MSRPFHVRTILPALVTCWLLAPAAGAGQVAVALQAAEAGATEATPYRQASLTVTNGLDETISAVSLRADDGGPTLLLPLTAPPGGRGRRNVALPATSPEQTYTVRLLDRYDTGGGGPTASVLAETQAPISWPVERVAAERILSRQAFAAFQADRPTWPTTFRQQVLIALAGMTVLTGFVLAIPGRRWRVALVLGVTAGGSALLAWMVSQAGPPVVSSKTVQLLQRDADGGGRHVTVSLAGGRRTAGGQGRLAGAWCMYPSRSAMAADRTVLRPDEPRLSDGPTACFRVTPGRLHLLAACRPWGPQTAMVGTASALAKVAATVVGDPADSWSLAVDRRVPPAVLVTGDRVAGVEAMGRRTPQRIAFATARPMRHMRNAPQEFGFDAESMKLFTWWDQTRRDARQVYLVWPGRIPGRLYVTTVTVR